VKAQHSVKVPKSRPHILWRVVRLPVIVYMLVTVVMMIFEESLIFFPMRYPDGFWRTEGLPIEDAQFDASDATRLHGWYMPHNDPRAVVLFCHGNAGNVTHRIETLRALHRRVGASVLIFDYRGYGKSEGKPNERGVLADARAARKWLAGREGIAESQVVLIGRSLGGAVAVDLAATDGAKALVLESTFTSIPDLAAHYYPWLPVRWLMRTRLDSASKIAAYHGPLLQTHGNADTTIPFEFGEQLFQAANEPKQFITLPGLDHNDPQPPDYFDELTTFLGGIE